MLPEQAVVLWSNNPNSSSGASVLQPLGRMVLRRNYFQAVVPRLQAISSSQWTSLGLLTIWYMITWYLCDSSCKVGPHSLHSLMFVSKMHACSDYLYRHKLDLNQLIKKKWLKSSWLNRYQPISCTFPTSEINHVGFFLFFYFILVF